MDRRRQAVVVGTIALGVLAVSSCSSNSAAPPVVTVNLSASAVPAASGSAGSAAASNDQDKKFLTALGGAVENISHDQAISSGRRTCGALSEGSSAKDIRTVLVQKGLTDLQAARVMLAAVSVYCPELKSKASG